MLNKGAYFTDLHFGKKANSDLHNQDCSDFVDWFCEQVKADPEIDYIAFLGDWHENRSAVNISTLKYSYMAAKKLNELGLPIYFVVGNHDLYHRHTREVHSIHTFDEFDNFVVIDEPVIREEINGGVLFSPYLFHNEYPDLAEYLKVPIWAGHFEFRGFVVTGYSVTMPTGPEAKDYEGPKHIFSGHFHKRQATDQVAYIGNTFPMDFGDAGDNNRGMMTYNHSEDDCQFINWEDCPKYVKTTLSDILEGNVTIYPHSRVKCIVDINVSFEESNVIRQKFLEDYNLREFVMEESPEIAEALSGTESTVDATDELASVNDLVMQMLNEIENDKIDNHTLVKVYQQLK